MIIHPMLNIDVAPNGGTLKRRYVEEELPGPEYVEEIAKDNGRSDKSPFCRMFTCLYKGDINICEKMASTLFEELKSFKKIMSRHVSACSETPELKKYVNFHLGEVQPLSHHTTYVYG